ncbi:MAG: DMT family transporter [Clostridia bacterium]|nr:DMT family transporter [Clostridia bacterium]
MLMKNKNERLGMFFVIASAVLFGLMPLLTKVAYQHGSNAYSVAFGRFFIGSVILFLIILCIPNCNIKITRLQLMELVKLSFFYALMPILLYRSYEYIDSGLATTLHFTYPIVVVIIMAVFCKAKPDAKQSLCMCISIVGILLLYTPGGQTSIRGILLAVLSGVTYAFYIVLLGKSRLGELHPLVLSFWIACFSAIEIGTIGCLTKSIRFDMDATAWTAEVILAVLTTVIALVLFQRGVYLCGEIKASLLSSFEPVTGILVGVFVFYEKISWNEMVGIISIIIAAIVLVVPSKKSYS